MGTNEAPETADNTNCLFGTKNRTLIEGITKDMNGMSKKVDSIHKMIYGVGAGVIILLLTELVKLLSRGRIH